MRGLDLGSVTRREEADAALASAIPDASLRAFLLQNLVLENGGFHWRLNLDAIAGALPAIMAFPTLTSRFDGPTTFLAGERSNYIRPRDEPAIRSLFPQSKIVEIGQAGHWAHAEQPERFLALVKQALS
jgi:pimeloyl-ACP methyl ester carboxylesterase